MIALTATKTLLDVIVNRFQNEKQLLVYGAGRNAGIFCSSMKDSACQLVFFDRRSAAALEPEGGTFSRAGAWTLLRELFPAVLGLAALSAFFSWRVLHRRKRKPDNSPDRE